MLDDSPHEQVHDLASEAMFGRILSAGRSAGPR